MTPGTSIAAIAPASEMQSAAPASRLQQHVGAALSAGYPSAAWRAFHRVFALKLATFGLLFEREQELAMIALLLGASLTMFDRTARLGLGGLLFYRLLIHAHAWPFAINHVFFETWLLLFLLLGPVRARDGDPRGAVDAYVPFLVVGAALLVWFYAGVQKVVHGHYLTGELLAMHGLDPTGPLHGFFRALGLRPMRITDGVVAIEPMTRIAVLVMSWSVVLGELLLPWALLVPKFRRRAATILLALLVLIVVPTGELAFGCVAAGTLLLAVPEWARWTYPALAALQIPAALLMTS